MSVHSEMGKQILRSSLSGGQHRSACGVPGPGPVTVTPPHFLPCGLLSIGEGATVRQRIVTIVWKHRAGSTQQTLDDLQRSQTDATFARSVRGLPGARCRGLGRAEGDAGGEGEKPSRGSPGEDWRMNACRREAEETSKVAPSSLGHRDATD